MSISYRKVCRKSLYRKVYIYLQMSIRKVYILYEKSIRKVYISKCLYLTKYLRKSLIEMIYTIPKVYTKGLYLTEESIRKVYI